MYKATKLHNFLNESTLEYSESRWCVLRGVRIVCECHSKRDADRIVEALNKKVG